MAMKIDIRPDPVNQGGRVLLKVEGGPSPQDNDYTWELVNFPDQPVFMISEGGLKAYLDTTSMPPNLYEVRVIAQPKPGFSGDPVSAEAVFNIIPAPLSRDFVENVIQRAQNMVDRISTPPGPKPAAGPTIESETGESLLGKRKGPEDVNPPLPVRVTMERRFPENKDSENNLALWQAVRIRTEAVKFNAYQDYIDEILCSDNDLIEARRRQIVSEFHGVDAYNLLKTATEAFLMARTGVFIPDMDANIPGEESRVGRPVTYADVRSRLNTYLGGNGLPYLDRIVRALGDRPPSGTTRAEHDKNLTNYPDCVYDTGRDNRNILIFDEGFRHPLMLELIWNYWHEEGMLVQTINAITMRMQNRRGPMDRDPLLHLELNPLRPLNNLLWGYLQEEYRRLTVQRRAYEYDHHYGLNLYGKAVPEMTTADSRSRFLEAFHNLLTLCTKYYKQADDTTVTPDPFPLLNALKEVHLILANGAHNQFGDLPWTARVEMLTQQWLLARPEMNDYLHGRPMVPYEEEWMGRVDTMKTLQGWGDTTVTHFHNLAVFGEQLLLSIRYTDWVGINIPSPAGVWALYWRAEIQGYIHAYRATTGVDLSTDASANLPTELRYKRPSELLRQRLMESRNGRDGKNGKATPLLEDKPATAVPAHQTFRERKALRK